MSAEKYSRRALRKLTVSRVIGSTLNGIGAISHAIGYTFEGYAQAAFLNECDAARRYQAATGYELGAAQGQPLRYSDDVAEWPQNRLEGGEDD